jgi:hypothetical protein
MKKFTLLSIFAALLLQGCMTSQFTNRESEFRLTGFDFREYTARGFLFMTESYYGEYEVLGVITVELHPKVVYQKGRTGQGIDYDVYYIYHDGVRSQLVQHMNIETLIEEVYNVAVEWGGDGFTHFEARQKTAYTDAGNPNSAYNYLAVSGVVIKRK